MYQIKQIPEDFLVKEISKAKAKERGSYLLFKLVKKNYNTLDAVKLISEKLKILVKKIGFAGSKDRKAVTEQIISVKGRTKERVSNLKLKNIELKFLGYGNEPISLGELEGNAFEIVVRNLDNFELKEVKKMVNYFGEQRFGGNNIAVGRALVKKEFSKACSLLGLKVENNDYIGAIKTVPLRLLRLYVNAYQSYLWNETVKAAVEKGIKVEEVPLVGFGTELDKFPKLKEIIEDLLKQEGVGLNDFIIKQIPELSLEGELRKVFVSVKELKVLEKGEDELNAGKKKVKISFSLGKGSYGTRVVKEMFG